VWCLGVKGAGWVFGLRKRGGIGSSKASAQDEREIMALGKIFKTTWKRICWVVRGTKNREKKRAWVQTKGRQTRGEGKTETGKGYKREGGEGKGVFNGQQVLWTRNKKICRRKSTNPKGKKKNWETAQEGPARMEKL